MTTSRRLALIILVGALAGCDGAGSGGGTSTGSGGNAQLLNDLKKLGLDYHNYHDVHAKGPASWEELQKESSDPQAVQRVRDAGYQVTWGAEFKNISQGLSNSVLAQKPGGPKLMMDGAVQQ